MKGQGTVLLAGRLPWVRSTPADPDGRTVTSMASHRSLETGKRITGVTSIPTGATT
jgi:hypothetical protein